MSAGSRSAGLLVVAAVVTAGGFTVPATASTYSTGTRLVRTAAVLPGLDHARYLGPAASGQVLTIGVALRHPDPAGEAALYQQIYTPGSPQYHRFLDPAQYDARFAVSAATANATESWLRSGGLQVSSVSGARDYITASGTVAQVAALMHTRFARYQAGPVPFVANTVAPLVPANLPMTTLLGLNTLSRMWTGAQVRAVDAGRAPGAAATPGASCGTPCQTLLTPQNLWGVYNLPATDTGQGETAGIFGEGYADAVVANLRVYERIHSLPEVPVRIVHTQASAGATANGDDTDNVEWYLDSAAITGMAPRLSQLDLYFGKSLFDADVAASFAAWASDPAGPKQMNASFGECETSPGNAIFGPLAQPPFFYGTELGDELEPAAEPSLLRANLEGRTLFSSAGDTGGSCPAIVIPILGAGNGVSPQPAPEDNYPCASTHVVCVGGTVVDTPGPNTPPPSSPATRQSEVSWTYTGGGPSGYIAEPKFQQGIAAINRTCLSQPDGTPYPPGTICRGAPDIADMSGNVLSPSPQTLLLSNSYAYENDMSPGGQGGTSLSSPLAVGMWSRVQAAAPTTAGLGFADETFYRIGKDPTTYARDFYDITASETAAGNFYNQPGPGWDYVSGLGAMNVAHLMSDVDHRLTPTHPTAQAAVPLVASGCPVVTSPAGNANNYLDPVSVQDPSLDIRTATLRSSGANLIATIYGPTISTSLPNGSTGSSFLLLWTQGALTYFAEAAVSDTGAVTYSDGTTAGGGYTTLKTIQGSFANGLITMTVPRADVGKPATGSELAYPYAIAVADLSGPTLITNPLGFTEDVASTAPDQALVVGAVCTNPAAIALAHAAGSGAGGRSTAASGSLPATGGRLGLLGLGGLVLLGLAAAVGRLRRTR
ncbi:MAG TPA: protease pro-enzyme activation domain-containing protein [Mycobacteriales bacterium]|nr:protease pro-enzyme activation domain-containing protein [Mycobacteriales bacterium]